MPTAAAARQCGIDENGAARDDEGKVVAPKDIEADSDYVYIPNTLLAKSYEGDGVKQILDAFFDHETPAYDGFGLNCASVTRESGLWRRLR